MIKLMVDSMGGDNGPSTVVEAVKLFLKDNKDCEVAVCGRKEELKELDGIARIIDAPDVLPIEAGVFDVLRSPNSSMMKAISTMRDEKFDAIISAGSTGGFLSASTVTLKLIPGVKRAALIANFPTKIKGKKMAVLDNGASNENNAKQLVQFAQMGVAYAQTILNIEHPRVYLLSNGSEDEKGSPISKEAFKMLTEMNFEGFKGNIEARDILNGDCDVLVTDGYTGNIMLKGIEGMGKAMSELLNKAFRKNFWTKIGYLHVRKGIKNMKETFDSRSVGGAVLLGINGIVVKAHGNSDSITFCNAMKVAKRMVENDLINKIKERVKDEIN